MAEYKIEATIEKLELNGSKLEIQLKGAGKYLFEKDKEYYNILEKLQSPQSAQTNALTTKPAIFPLDMKEKFSITQNTLLEDLIGSAFIENKRLKFGIVETCITYSTYSITSISKAD
jgi:hypothetical protein